MRWIYLYVLYSTSESYFKYGSDFQQWYLAVHFWLTPWYHLFTVLSSCHRAQLRMKQKELLILNLTDYKSSVFCLWSRLLSPLCIRAQWKLKAGLKCVAYLWFLDSLWLSLSTTDRINQGPGPLPDLQRVCSRCKFHHYCPWICVFGCSYSLYNKTKALLRPEHKKDTSTS